VFEGVARLDKGLSAGTAGHFDLRTLVLTGLLSAAALQLYRGNIIGPAVPMLISAMNLAHQISTSAKSNAENGE
jgi:hypothetical protein